MHHKLVSLLTRNHTLHTFPSSIPERRYIITNTGYSHSNGILEFVRQHSSQICVMYVQSGASRTSTVLY